MTEETKLEWACRQIEALHKHVAKLEAEIRRLQTPVVVTRLPDAPSYTVGPGGIPLP